MRPAIKPGVVPKAAYFLTVVLCSLFGHLSPLTRAREEELRREIFRFNAESGPKDRPVSFAQVRCLCERTWITVYAENDGA